MSSGTLYMTNDSVGGGVWEKKLVRHKVQMKRSDERYQQV